MYDMTAFSDEFTKIAALTGMRSLTAGPGGPTIGSKPSPLVAPSSAGGKKFTLPTLKPRTPSPELNAAVRETEAAAAKVKKTTDALRAKKAPPSMPPPATTIRRGKKRGIRGGKVSMRFNAGKLSPAQIKALRASKRARWVVGHSPRQEALRQAAKKPQVAKQATRGSKMRALLLKALRRGR